MEEFERELLAEGNGHLYARECCANTWYAIGALRLRQRRTADAAIAFGQAMQRVPRHPMARLGRALSAPPYAPPVPADIKLLAATRLSRAPCAPLLHTSSKDRMPKLRSLLRRVCRVPHPATPRGSCRSSHFSMSPPLPICGHRR
jgi:hypothetical protein